MTEFTSPYSDFHEVLNTVHDSEETAALRYTVGKVFIAIRCVGTFYSQDGTPREWRRRAPKRAGVLVKQHNWCMRGGALHVSLMKTDNCEHNAARQVHFQDKNKDALWVARKDVSLLDPCALCSSLENQSPLLLSAALATLLATCPLNRFSMYLSNFSYRGDGRQHAPKKRRHILHGPRTRKSVT